MPAWNGGYITEVNYTHGYYRELNPLWLKFVMAYAGYAFPDTGHACELGFGQGLSINIHASASAWQWHGTDFNPAQVGFAHDLARRAGHTASLHDDSFEEFAARGDLPDFDFIALHGIWSWIRDESRHAILDLIRRKLKVGGVVYISYNALSGWAPMMPIRQLLAGHALRSGGAALERARQALDFCQRLVDSDPLYLRLAPQTKERLAAMREQPMEYLLHEYFNRQWEPQSFCDFAGWMAKAKLDFACSADAFDQVEALHTTAEQQTVLGELADPILRQDVRDLMLGRSFRKDCWIKGARMLSAGERDRLIDSQRVILCTPRAHISMTVTGATREATMKDDVNRPLLDLLERHEPVSIGELQSQLLPQGISQAQVREAVLVLAGSGHLHPVQDGAEQARQQAQALNRHILDQGDNILQYLASPVTGGGIAVDHVSRLMLAAAQASDKPEDWVDYAWQRLAASGQVLLKDGQTLPDEASNLAELRSLADSFQRERRPLLRALGISTPGISLI
ncbi:class I SAM-dependent methyltransferase [Bordetella pseudohinzii]|uniref:Methyltransferase n=1 Tax=Bordetella pseudohinzii TaxID=1331258 RepID=A0A0J6EU45_9BORD|nr:class I SAM-dependent methyltransferase [Bordetella pseudohinzii]ANY15690.1 methyltransferase [Bordetella pseudohinzii]KMM23960.1 methyltransferase [Bordetella pseudohinzii]CUJ17366.1 Predicted methyltransferase regulatory domain [Bordetella pseudohinzii]